MPAKKDPKKAPGQVELPQDFDAEVIRHIQTLASHWGCLQRDVVGIALKQFVERYPLEHLTRLPNPCEGESTEEDEPP